MKICDVSCWVDRWADAGMPEAITCDSLMTMPTLLGSIWQHFKSQFGCVWCAIVYNRHVQLSNGTFNNSVGCYVRSAACDIFQYLARSGQEGPCTPSTPRTSTAKTSGDRVRDTCAWLVDKPQLRGLTDHLVSYPWAGDRDNHVDVLDLQQVLERVLSPGPA